MSGHSCGRPIPAVGDTIRRCHQLAQNGDYGTCPFDWRLVDPERRWAKTTPSSERTAGMTRADADRIHLEQEDASCANE